MPTTEEPLNPVPKRRGTLLVVDDEDGPRESMRVIFKDEYDLLMAEDGPTAIELASQLENLGGNGDQDAVRAAIDA